jgi:hypothetical protein
LKSVILLLSLTASLPAVEIATGAMLGRGYDPRAFYTRNLQGGFWQKTYSGAPYKPEAQGKLMNVRLAQALFEDEWMKERPFDPDRNTDEVIGALDFYRRHGVLMVNVSLQGGQAGYEKDVNGIDRLNGYRYGPARGSYVSAFRPDGSLKPSWMRRLARLLLAADERGMFVNVIYFYQGQDESFDSTKSIHAAVRNITDWLIAGNYRNVIIDIANEYDLGGGNWDFFGYIPQNILPLVDEVRSRFQKARFVVPVSASSDGRMRYPESLAGQVDLVLLHGNSRPPEFKAKRALALAGVERPVLMTEDDNGRPTTVENLKGDLASADIFFRYAAGWGYMPWTQAQRFPFCYLPGAGNRPRDDMPEKDRDMAYFHAVLDHVAGLTLQQLPD